LELLRHNGLRLAVAESCTGGMIACYITGIPGASDCFSGGVVAYTREMKINILGVPGMLIDGYGLASEETALEMARGVCGVTGAEIGLSVTGVAGPSGDGSETPVGTVCIAVYDTRDKSYQTAAFVFGGGRDRVREAGADAALEMVRAKLAL
jgi:PncC family amidohydrolase